MNPTTKAKVLHVLALIVYGLLVAGPSLVTGFTSIGMPSIAHAVSGVLLVVGLPIIRQMLPIPTVAASMRIVTAAAKVATSTLFLVALGVLLVGCTPSVATVPVTPANQDQITACKSLSSTRNALVVGDFSLGVLDGAAAGIAAGLASSNPTGAKDIGIGTTAGAGVVAGGVLLAAFYANAYAAQHCPDVLGPLPPLPAKRPDPPVEITIVKSPGAVQ